VSFTRVNPSGWAQNDPITPQQINDLDTDHALAVDGRGGAYANSTMIEFSGSGGFRLSGSGNAGRVQYGSRTNSRVIQASKFHNNLNFTRSNITGEYDHWQQSSVGSAGKLLIDLDDLPHGNELTSVQVDVVGSTSGSFSGITMPTVSVWRITSAAAETQIGSTATDGSGTNAAYTALHSITAGSLAHTIDRATNTYFVKFTGATGGTAAVGLVIRRVLVTCTMTIQPEW